MPTFKDQSAVDAALSKNDPGAAFAILAKHPDLRHADLPAVNKKALDAIGKDPAATRAFAEGAVHPSVSVRRFVRKYGSKLGGAAGAALFAIAAQNVEPTRDGGAVARHVKEEGYSTAPPREPAVYNDATRYAREAMDTLIFLLGQTNPTGLVRLFEYCDALARTKAREKEGWDPLALNGVVMWYAGEHLRKDEQTYGEAVLRWAHGKVLLDEPSDDPTAKLLAERFRGFPEEGLKSFREILPAAHARFHGIPREKRLELYKVMTSSSAPPRIKGYFDRELENYRRQFPEEAKEAALAAGSASAAPSAEGDDGRGPQAKAVLSNLAWVAFRIGADDLGRKIDAELDEYSRADEDDIGKDTIAAAPGEREAIENQFLTVLEKRRPRPEHLVTKRRGAFGADPQYVSEKVIDECPGAAALAGFFERFARSEVRKGHSWQFTIAAATLLPARELVRIASVMEEKKIECHLENDLLATFADRGIAPAPFVRAALLQPRADGCPPLTEHWQCAMAQLWFLGGAEGRAIVRAAMEEFPLPSGKWAYDDRKGSYAVWQSLLWSAWQEGDVDLVATALSRCALPYYTKGERALLSEVPRQLEPRGYAPTPATTGSVPLEELFARILDKAPGRVPAIVTNALAAAEVTEIGGLVVERAAKAGGAWAKALLAKRDEVLGLLESSRPNVVASGLVALAAVPALAEGRADETIGAVERALSSSSSGTAQEAAATLAVLANALPEHRARCVEALANALSLEAPAVLQKILRAIGDARGDVALPEGTDERLHELARDDPKRFAKLVDQIVQVEAKASPKKTAKAAPAKKTATAKKKPAAPKKPAPKKPAPKKKGKR